jgi:hypothetical protein
MPGHHYDVHVIESVANVEPLTPGEPAASDRDVYWSGEAESPEAATEIARRTWGEKYGESAPADAEVRITLGPKVCPACEGRGWQPRYLPPGLHDPGDDAPLGSARKRRCPDCLGSGERH